MFHGSLTHNYHFISVAAGVLAINEAIEKPDSADLLLALKSKSVALKSITPECADGYHRELKDTKDKKDDVGEWLFPKKSYKWGGNYQFEVHKKNIEQRTWTLLQCLYCWLWTVIHLNPSTFKSNVFITHWFGTIMCTGTLSERKKITCMVLITFFADSEQVFVNNGQSWAELAGGNLL